MHDQEALSNLVGKIYDASLNPALWAETLEETKHFVRGMAAAVFCKDPKSKTGGIYYDDGGISPHFKRIYFEKYIKLDPMSAGHYFAKIEEPISTADLIEYDEFVETRFYQEWARPQGVVDFVSASLDKSSTTTSMFGVFRHERDGLVDDATRQRMRLIVPHIRRALLVSRTIEMRTAEAATLATALDGLNAGLFLVDDSARVVHANASARSMLADGTVLRARGGKLVAREARAQQALSEVFAASGQGDAAVGLKGIAVPMSATSGDQYVAHVLPLTGRARRRAGGSHAAAAAMFLHSVSAEAPAPAEAIAKAFSLTPGELRVLLTIVQVSGVAEAAEALGIGEATVKTHLHRLFQKTGAGRQAELVRLVERFSSPLAAV
ncbi:MAG: hypothetical protein BGN89_10535 [Alphaproteobacteria bacterium 64-6]|nr:MAG: hypothetical protein BGN89_10535 [Alphaproteobacteria bacterium 64-6]